MVSLKIDGIDANVDGSLTILEAAEAVGVNIPTFCHHKMLNPFGACRVCLVEVKGNPKLLTACTTPVMDGMEIITNSEKLAKIRKTLIELLLINHPLDCPVCDKGGECTLQDLAFEFGVTKVRFDEVPMKEPVDHSNPFIERDINRCVLCGKCVRICDEVVNVQAISFIGRGTDTYIGTAFDQAWNCEYCGQCMSVCPVGSLGNRVFLHKNRPWNMKTTYSICGLCSCGCTVVLKHENNKVYRVDEDTDAGINHGFLCSKGRYGYEFINSDDRPENSNVKMNNVAKDIDLKKLIEPSIEKLKNIIDNYGSDAVGMVVSPRLTNEEAFLAQKLCREVLKSNNIYSLEPVTALPDATYDDVDKSDAILVLNMDITESNPILGLSIRRRVRKSGVPLVVFYPSSTALKRLTDNIIVGEPKELYKEIDSFVSSLEGKSEKYKDLVSKFKSAEKPLLVFNPYNEIDLYYVERLKKLIPGLKLLPARSKNNSQGILDMGCHSGIRPGYQQCEAGYELAEGIKKGRLKALIVLGENLDLSPEYCSLFDELDKLGLLVVLDPFMSEMSKKAHLYIPVASYVEKDGSFTNFEGRVQSIQKAIDKGFVTDRDFIVSVAEFFNVVLPHSTGDIRVMITQENPLYKDISWDGEVIKYPYLLKHGRSQRKDIICGDGGYNLYPASLRLHSGSYTRRSPELSKVYSEPLLEINPADARDLNVENGEYIKLISGVIEEKFKVDVNEKMSLKTVSLPDNYPSTARIFSVNRYLKVDLKR